MVIFGTTALLATYAPAVASVCFPNDAILSASVTERSRSIVLAPVSSWKLTRCLPISAVTMMRSSMIFAGSLTRPLTGENGGGAAWGGFDLLGVVGGVVFWGFKPRA